MQIAFRTGGTVGLATTGLGLLGASVVVLVYTAARRRCWRASALVLRCWPCS